MRKNLVSIIIPAYNAEKYIAKTLDSVIAQTYKDWECIIVDDGSTDNTYTVADNYTKKDNRIRVYHQDNQGVSTARNNAIKMSSGVYILPLDADDAIEPEYITLAASHLDANPKTKLVYCKANRFGVIQGEMTLPKYDYNSLLWNNCILCSAIYRRKDYDETGGYNPNMKYGFEDWDFLLSLLGPKDDVYRIEKTLFHYRARVQSRNTTVWQDPKEMLRQMYLNHKDLYNPYLSDIIYNKQLALEYEKTNNELQHIRSSYAYKLGKILLRPLSILRHKCSTSPNISQRS